jgi:hypothetical protein
MQTSITAVNLAVVAVEVDATERINKMKFQKHVNMLLLVVYFQLLSMH